MQHSQSVRRGRAREVPFGVRALESGIEIEGVWISGTNTPASSAPGTPALPAKAPSAHGELSPGRRSSATSTFHLEMPQSTRELPTVVTSNGNNQHPSPFADAETLSDTSHQGSPTSERLPHGRPTYKPRRSSQLRYSNSMHNEDSESRADRRGHSSMPDRKGKQQEGT